ASAAPLELYRLRPAAQPPLRGRRSETAGGCPRHRALGGGAGGVSLAAHARPQAGGPPPRPDLRSPAAPRSGRRARRRLSRGPPRSRAVAAPPRSRRTRRPRRGRRARRAPARGAQGPAVVLRARVQRRRRGPPPARGAGPRRAAGSRRTRGGAPPLLACLGPRRPVGAAPHAFVDLLEPAEQ